MQSIPSNKLTKHNVLLGIVFLATRVKDPNKNY
jgi:hypothetical protein